MDLDSFEFVIYIIHACANKWKISPPKVYKKLQSINCITDYLAKYYDILHTQSSDFVVNDIEAILKNRGVDI